MYTLYYYSICLVVLARFLFQTDPDETQLQKRVITKTRHCSSSLTFAVVTGDPDTSPPTAEIQYLRHLARFDVHNPVQLQEKYIFLFSCGENLIHLLWLYYNSVFSHTSRKF